MSIFCISSNSDIAHLSWARAPPATLVMTLEDWGRERQLSSSLLPFWQCLMGGGAISVTWKHSCWDGWSQRKLIWASPDTLKSSSRSNWPSLCPAIPLRPWRRGVMKASSCLISSWLKAGSLSGPPFHRSDQLLWDISLQMLNHWVRRNQHR